MNDRSEVPVFEPKPPEIDFPDDEEDESLSDRLTMAAAQARWDAIVPVESQTDRLEYKINLLLAMLGIDTGVDLPHYNPGIPQVSYPVRHLNPPTPRAVARQANDLTDAVNSPEESLLMGDEGNTLTDSTLAIVQQVATPDALVEDDTGPVLLNDEVSSPDLSSLTPEDLGQTSQEGR